jgi:hypothetical protein
LPASELITTEGNCCKIKGRSCPRLIFSISFLLTFVFVKGALSFALTDLISMGCSSKVSCEYAVEVMIDSSIIAGYNIFLIIKIYDHTGR